MKWFRKAKCTRTWRLIAAKRSSASSTSHPAMKEYTLIIPTNTPNSFQVVPYKLGTVPSVDWNCARSVWPG